MNKNILLIGVVAIMAALAVFAFANPEPNKGADTANPSENGREHANANAAFNRGDGGLPGDSCDEHTDCVSGECDLDPASIGYGTCI